MRLFLTGVFFIFTVRLVTSIRFAIDPPDVTVNSGQTATLQCQVINRGSFSVYWWSVAQSRYLSRDTTFYPEAVNPRFTIVGNHHLGFYNLRIANVNTQDAGQYHCVIEPVPGKGTLFKPVNLMVRLQSPHSPICTSHPRENVKVGQVVTISCSSEGGVPPPHLTWFQNRHAVVAGPSSSSVLTYTFIVEGGHNGIEFTCSSSHPTFTQSRSCSIVPFRPPPEINIEPALFRGFVGSAVNFTCIPSRGSITEFEYSWFFANHPVNLDNRRMKIAAEGRVLMISNLLFEDNGVSVRCVARNSDGISSATAVIRVINLTTQSTFIVNTTEDTTQSTFNVNITEEDFGNLTTIFPDSKTVEFGGSASSKSNSLIIVILIVAIVVGQILFIAVVYVIHKVANRMRKPKDEGMPSLEAGVRRRTEEAVSDSVGVGLQRNNDHLYKSLHRYDTANNALGITPTVRDIDTYSAGTLSFTDDVYHQVPSSSPGEYEVPRSQTVEDYVEMRSSVTSSDQPE
ncbi:hypothetical protein BSL78_15731 [Apostichopus japonicus]|uniref:Ig-like domain-containing protein n=1 Tax=Stichopus japonicus TaxID=307972 RepID=A0A2G8KHC3_STIJA|nr:hypothetical protein BSL78_15731 [Apostichopus japonicus]